MTKKSFIVLALMLMGASVYAQKGIKAKILYSDVQYLAADEMQGRWPGSEGDYKTRRHISKAFIKAGVQPMLPGFEQLFTTTVKLKTPAKENFLRVANGRDFTIDRDYSIYPFSGNGQVKAKIIHGATNEESLLQLQEAPGSWVMLWRSKPVASPMDSLSDRGVAMRAIRAGAAGVLLVSPDSVDKEDKLVRLRPRKGERLTIPVVQVRRTAWETIQKENVLEMKVQFDPEIVQAANMVGLIEGADPVLKNEYIVIGAHYDHLGDGGFGTGSLKPDTVAIHNGADDNASGTAVLLGIARELSRNRKKLKRSVIVVAFAAEEEGLLGSDYFVNQLPVEPAAVKLMMNMDMMGRLNDAGNLYMGGAGTFDGGLNLMHSLKEGSGLDPVIHAGGVGGSDHVSFYRKNIPVIGFHTGGHPQYHTPEDDAVFINAMGMEKAARYIYKAMVSVCNWPGNIQFVKQD